MLSLLQQAQTGLASPRSVVVAETSRRILNLELSSIRTIDKCHHASINTLDIEQIESRYLLSGGFDGGIYIHDLQNSTGSPRYTAQCICKLDRSNKYAHRYSVGSVQWYPLDSGLFTSSSMDHQLNIWDTNAQKCVEAFDFQTHINGHHVSPIAPALVAVALSHSMVVMVDLRSGSPTHELHGHRGGKVRVVKWSPFEQNLLASGGTDHRVLFWDVRCAKTHLKSLDQFNEGQGKKAASSSTAHNGTVNAMCFTPDGLFLLTWGTDNHLRLWDVAHGENTLVNYGKLANPNARRSLQIDVCYDTNPAAVFLPLGNTLVALDMFTGMKLNTLTGHFNSVNCCTLRPGYQELYSGGSDRNILLWTPDQEQEAAYEASLKKEQPVTLSRPNILGRANAIDQWSSSSDSD